MSGGLIAPDLPPSALLTLMEALRKLREDRLRRVPRDCTPCDVCDATGCDDGLRCYACRGRGYWLPRGDE